MVKRDLEYAHVKQPHNLNLYIEKVKTMDQRTIISYHKRWEKLLNTQSSNLSLPEKITNIIDKILFDANNLSIKPSTFRVYKASILYGLAETQIKLDNETILDSDLDSGLNEQFLSNKYEVLVNLKADYGKISDYERKTSSLKKKSFPRGFYSFLLNLNPSPTSRTFLLIQFVQANILVGLRPVEWLDATICSNTQTQALTLIVANGKNSNGRANGDYRELLLNNATKDEKYNIYRFFITFQNKLKEYIDAFHEYQLIYERKATFLKDKVSSPLSHILLDFNPTILGATTLSNIHIKNVPQKGCADQIFKSLQNEMYLQFNAYKKTNPTDIDDIERVTLYSTRHQCIANAKASGISKFEIAGFFGHADKETSSKHYGKAWQGWSSFKFKPTVETILAVKQSADYVYQQYGIKQALDQSYISDRSTNEIQFNI